MNIQGNQIESLEQKAVLTALASFVARSGCMFLELGSWAGDSTVVLGKIAKANNGLLYCIDSWKGTTGTYLENIARNHDIFSYFWERIKNEGLEDVVIPIRAKTDAAFEVLKKESFDFIFIDADHSYNAVIKDIEHYAPLVKKGSILCGHDCEGRISDYDINFLEAGKYMDSSESVHCGVVLGVGRKFKNYSINHAIWSVKSTGNKGWAPTDIDFSGLVQKRQFPPGPVCSTKSFHVFRYGRNVYALPKNAGNNDITDEGVRNGAVAVAKTVAELEKLIKEKADYTPSPVYLESYMAYNIIWYKNRAYAFAQSIGSLDITQATKNDLQMYTADNRCIITDSLYEAKFKLAQMHCEQLENKLKGLQPAPQTDHPALLESYNGYNIIWYKNRAYAFAQSIGSLDIAQATEDDLQKYTADNRCVITGSLNEAKLRLAEIQCEELKNKLKGLQPAPQTKKPVLIESYNSYNIVGYNGRYYAFAQSIGHLDITSASKSKIEKYVKNKQCVIASSSLEVKLRIAELNCEKLENELGEIKTRA